jgi:hypothetical protein
VIKYYKSFVKNPVEFKKLYFENESLSSNSSTSSFDKKPARRFSSSSIEISDSDSESESSTGFPPPETPKKKPKEYSSKEIKSLKKTVKNLEKLVKTQLIKK